MNTGGLGGFGNIAYRGALPVGGGATSANPVGGGMMGLLSMFAKGGGQQMPPATDPAAELEMAKMLGLVRGQAMASGRPMEDWLDPRKRQMFGYGRDSR